MMKEEANNLRSVIDVLHSKHKEYADQVATYKSNHSNEQSEIKRLGGTWMVIYENIFVVIIIYN